MSMIKKYILCVTAVLCCAGIACGVMTAENRTRRLRFDEKTVQVFMSKGECLQDSDGNILWTFEKIKDGAERVLSLSPPPVGTVYWLWQSLRQHRTKQLCGAAEKTYPNVQMLRRAA